MRANERRVTAADNPETIITIREAADVIAVSEPTIWRKLTSGELARLKVGRSTRVKLGDVLGLVRAAR